MENLYDMLFKRKSIRKYDKKLSVSEKEMQLIKQQIEALVPLDKDIGVRFKIVKREETSARWGEYCLLIYSEKKANYLLNAGYMLEQMDLFFASLDIGACWVGMANPEEQQLDGLDFVIMITFGKSRPEDFRKDLAECNRKDSSMIWQGKFDPAVVDAACCAPSACNSQPWRVVSEDHCIQVYRNPSTLSLTLSKNRLHYFNAVDMGIFLCFLEISLQHNKYLFKRTVCEEQDTAAKQIKIAEYSLLS